MFCLKKSVFLTTVSMAVPLGAALAEEPHHHDATRAHEAHVHGAWELFAALDDSRLTVTMNGPIVDLLGFERLPETEEEHAAVRALEDRLSTPQALFAIDERAQCTIVKPVNILLPEGFAKEGANSEIKTAHRSGEHSHDKEHDDHEHEKGHGHHEHEEGHHDHDIHDSDLEVSYIFDCRSPTKLREITSAAFEAFPSIETVDAVFLGDNAQKAQKLTRNSKTLQID